ncbi:MAG TPA: protein kinase [Polyangiaceae bacterium]|nr:protein kinase [Polyangiaceae bacterium]
MLQPNQIFAQRYRVVRHIADGGMGAVYEAEHVATEARVALKLLHRHVVGLSSARRRFELEAKVAARINSEHIVKVFDAGLDHETHSPYLAMELLAGQTLAARVRQSGPLDTQEVLTLARQLARGLDAAHDYRTPDGQPQPIIHRDLKPENLFLAQRADGTTLVKILDYGIAKVLSAMTEVSQELRGTPLYMAFEQAAGEALSPQTDIWAFGLIIFFALTGRHYWPAASKPDSGAPALFAEILALPLQPPSARLRAEGLSLTLPLAFDGWLLTCLDRTPARRFASAGQAADALARALARVEPAAEGVRRPAPRAVTTLLEPPASLAQSNPSMVAVERRPPARAAPSHHVMMWLGSALFGLAVFTLALVAGWQLIGRTPRPALEEDESATRDGVTTSVVRTLRVPASRAGGAPATTPPAPTPATPAPSPAGTGGASAGAASEPAAPMPRPTPSPATSPATSPARPPPRARATGERAPRPEPAPKAAPRLPAAPRAGGAPGVEPEPCAFFDPYTGRCSQGAPER